MIDLKRQAELHAAIELLYFGYRGFTDGPDRILARRGLGRTHHRILYFIGRRPDISVQGLLALLAVSKQALNAPLRQLMQLDLVAAAPAAHDRRIKNLRLSPEGLKLEAELTGVQMRLLQGAFAAADAAGERSWRAIMTNMAGAER